MAAGVGQALLHDAKHGVFQHRLEPLGLDVAVQFDLRSGGNARFVRQILQGRDYARLLEYQRPDARDQAPRFRHGFGEQVFAGVVDLPGLLGLRVFEVLGGLQLHDGGSQRLGQTVVDFVGDQLALVIVRFQQLSQHAVLLAQRFLGPFSFGDVAADPAIAEAVTRRVENRHAAGFDHHERTVLVREGGFQHGKGPSRREQFGEWLGKTFDFFRRHQVQRRLADSFPGLIAEQVGYLGTAVGKPAGLIEFPDPIAGRFDQGAIALFALLELGNDGPIDEDQHQAPAADQQPDRADNGQGGPQERRADFRQIDLGDPAPVQARDGTMGGQHRLAKVIESNDRIGPALQCQPHRLVQGPVDR